MAARSVHYPLPRETSSPGFDEGIRRKRPKRRSPFKSHVQPSAATSKNARQIAYQQAVSDAQAACQFTSGNDIFSCFPTSDVVIPQDEWATFVWNSRQPTYQYTNLVNIYLFRADSRQPVLQMINVTNPYPQAGIVTAQVNDSWWGSDGSNWSGKNLTYPFFWLVAPNTKFVDNLPVPQTTFSAVQTTYADSVLASMSSSVAASVSSVSASASLASYLSSLSASSASARESKSAGSPSSGNLQNGANASPFPHWAIAVIVVLGFLAIVATCILVFLILRRIRRRRNESNRNSMGSASPMMADMQQQSPTMANAPQSSSGHHGAIPASLIHDGASSISRPGSATETGPFSHADAAIMADAYRKVLRKPDFTGRVEEDAEPEVKEDIITRELAEEGRDIRSVGSSRGVRVETLSDNGDTIQDRLRD
ncbi:hypothetical protein JOM56_010430 [Amanita muscaria]